MRETLIGRRCHLSKYLYEVYFVSNTFDFVKERILPELYVTCSHVFMGSAAYILETGPPIIIYKSVSILISTLYGVSKPTVAGSYLAVGFFNFYHGRFIRFPHLKYDFSMNNPEAYYKEFFYTMK